MADMRAMQAVACSNHDRAPWNLRVAQSDARKHHPDSIALGEGGLVAFSMDNEILTQNKLRIVGKLDGFWRHPNETKCGIRIRNRVGQLSFLLNLGSAEMEEIERRREGWAIIRINLIGKS
jgi:hypothetical protein